jgi:Zn-dependent metalloprotease
MNRITLIALLAFIFLLILLPIDLLQSRGAAQTIPETRQAAIQRLKDSLSRRGHVKTNRATGLVDFVRLNRESTGSLVDSQVGSPREKSFAFFSEQSKTFGLTNPASELRLAKEESDRTGGGHLSFDQVYNGVPVFAGVIKTHFNSAGDLRAVNGVIVPDIELNTTPSRTSAEAASVALAKVQYDSPNTAALTARRSKLYIYRTGLAQGIEGEDHLVWEIEVSNGKDVREFVYVDAHSGKFVDQITGIHESLDRRVYDGENIDQFPPPSFPANPFWIEGQQFPTGVSRADEVIASTKDTYDLFMNSTGRDSFDGLGSTMYAIFDSGAFPGQALAFEIDHLTVFGMYLTTDDVVAHEWTHVYTYYANGLIYQWQPGALNEAYSDIFGETVDLLNGRGLDAPGGQREANECAYPMAQPTLHVNSPAFLQRDYTMGPSTFGPPFSLAGITAEIVLVDDGKGARSDGCQTPFRNASEVGGKIALIDRSAFGTCSYEEKLKNAQLNGASAVIIANDAASGDNPTIVFGFDPSITIPSGIIGYSDGQALRSPRARTVNATITGIETAKSRRWLMAEESVYQGVRDMWNPRCYENPGKVSDREYFCGTFDVGGVHENSGVPNHAYALLVDGGTYNGQTIQPLGLTKAAHIYLRAMLFYHTPTSDFADHAEALEAAASDLIGIDLPDLKTGVPSGQIITLSDLQQVHNVTLAVELRDPPAQCGFPTTILAKNPPADTCSSFQNTVQTIFAEDFETDPTSQWIVSREVADENAFNPRDWAWVNQLPDGRPGAGYFALDPTDDCDVGGLGQIGVLHLDSPVITLPRVMLGGPHLSFDHWVATEAGYDGGQLMISVNGGPFQLVDPSAFIYNGYNTALFPAVRGFEQFFNPRAGQPAFSGTERGGVRGSWGTSIIDLDRYAHSGDRIRLRWDLSTDFCFGTSQGWYVDNVRLYACGA